ncbi:MAG TPA: translocation/assembly module TamB domain-containing protein [Steroidobacteraceae bacterium]|nr:translocation/assembly module TamB domain-containing protein [Steroidobacteraceae bacterium]
MRRWLIGLLAGLIVTALAVPVALSWFVLYTEPGVNLLVRHLPRRIAHAEVQLHGVRGSVAHGLHIDQLLIHHRRVNLTFDDINLTLDLAPALLQTLHARKLDIGNLRIEVIRRTGPYVPTPLHFLPRWLNVRIDALHIARGTLVLPSGRQLEAAELRTHGVVRPRTAHYLDAVMRSGAIAFASHQGELRAALTLGVTADLAVNYDTTRGVPWRVQMRGDGDLNLLPFSARIAAPFQGNFNGSGVALTAAWHFEGHADVTHMALDTWGGSPRIGNIHGQLALHLDDHGFTAAGPIVPEVLDAGVFDARVRGAYAQRIITLHEVTATHRASGMHLTAAGTVGIEPGGPRLDLRGQWTHLVWPLARSPLLHSDAGQFAIAGTWPYSLATHADLAVAGLPALSVAFDAALYPEHIQISTATVTGRAVPLGKVDFAGEVHWLPHPIWSATGTASDVNPAAFASIAAGRLTFGFAASGAGFHATDPFSVQVQHLSGTMHNLPARASGRLAHAAGVWQLDGIHAQLAGTTLNLDGTLSDRADLKFDIRSPDLSLVMPGLKGHISGNGELHGAWRDPAVQATLSAGSLRFQQVAVEDIAARMDFDPTRTGPSHVDLHARGLTLGTRTIDDLSLKLDGEERSHELDMNVAAHDFSLKAHGNAAFTNGVWQATLRQMTVVGSDALNLALEAPAGVSLSAAQMHVDNVCLKGSPAHLCAAGEWTPAKWSLQASATELPMQTLTAGQSGNVDYRGIIGMSLKLFGSGLGPVEGTLSARLAGAQLRHRLAGGKIEITTLGDGDVQVTATPANVTAQLNMDAGPQGSIKGQLIAMRDGHAWRELPLDGSIALQTAQLDFVPLYVPQVDRAAGRLIANLNIAGTIAAPLLSGSLSLADGELDLYQINMAMRQAAFKATLQSNRLDFEGGAQFGAGHASVRGGLEGRAGVPHGELTLSGTQLRVADVPEAQIDASPNLTFHIDGTQIGVTGDVRIPRARIAPADLRHAVLASSDEVIVSSANPESTDHYDVTTDVSMTLGDDVTVEGLGLKARLSGKITEHAASNDQVTHASGELNVATGDYTAFGRKLQIEHGRLIFTGGPIGDPGVDVRAVKHFDDPEAGATLAGINVRGTLRQPQLSFFSEPSLPQQQIVALLLAGGGLVGNQGAGVPGTNATRGATNNELLGQGAAILGQQLGSHIGITDVGVESNFYNETSLVLGRYLSPRLYVSYGLGLTETLNTVKLRYTLGDHWTIRTEAGQIGGADLIYTLDK